MAVAVYPHHGLAQGPASAQGPKSEAFHAVDSDCASNVRDAKLPKSKRMCKQALQPITLLTTIQVDMGLKHYLFAFLPWVWD